MSLQQPWTEGAITASSASARSQMVPPSCCDQVTLNPRPYTLDPLKLCNLKSYNSAWWAESVMVAWFGNLCPQGRTKSRSLASLMPSNECSPFPPMVVYTRARYRRTTHSSSQGFRRASFLNGNHQLHRLTWSQITCLLAWFQVVNVTTGGKSQLSLHRGDIGGAVRDIGLAACPNISYHLCINSFALCSTSKPILRFIGRILW